MKQSEEDQTDVRAFFDQHLRSKPQPLLDQQSPSHPGVRFCCPQAETRA
jgi:hypothetical protein